MQYQFQQLHLAFESYAQNGKLKKATLASILPILGFNEMQIAGVIGKIQDEEINYSQFMECLGYYARPQNIQTYQFPPQQPIVVDEPIQSKFSQGQIQTIFEEVKTTLTEQNYEKLYMILWNYKGIDLVNMVDSSTKQISTYIAVQQANEILTLKILSLLADFRVNFNFKDSLKQSVLFYICRDGKLKLLDFVLSTNSVNINDQDIHGQTPLFYAARENKIDVVQRLVLCGADVNIVDTLSNQTALFYSAREGHTEICKILMESGCNPGHLDQQKKTALFFAKKFGKKEVVEYLNQCINKNRVGPAENGSCETPKNLKKKIKDLPKQAYKLLFTDEEGNQQEITASEFVKFQQAYPQIANLIVNADELIDENVLNQTSDEDSWQKIAKRVLQILQKAKGGYYFQAPVDVNKYGITDYYDIVKNPMDFGTIKKKLHTNIYKACQEFYNDVMLVFDNCILYNGTENEVGQVGVNLKLEFQNQAEQTNLNKYLQ